MKKIKLFLTFGFTFLIAFVNLSYSQRPPMPVHPKDKISQEGRYKILRGAGVVVIGGGTALLTASLKSIQKNNQYLKDNPGVRGEGLSELGRAFGVLVGGVWIAGGTFMTILGNYKLDKLKKVSVTSDGSSVTVAYSF